MKKEPGWFGYVGDDILPGYIGVIVNHEIRIPSLTNQDSIPEDPCMVYLPTFTIKTNQM